MGKNYKKHKEWLHTPNGRASTLLNAYNQMDKKHKRGKGDLTAKWIVENIFSQPCAHCGVTGWDIIGCNRLDNSKPHTMDNVEPCCFECNNKLHEKEMMKPVYQYTLDNVLICIYKCMKDAARQNGFSQGNISCCCLGLRKKAYGYKWSFNPL